MVCLLLGLEDFLLGIMILFLEVALFLRQLLLNPYWTDEWNYRHPTEILTIPRRFLERWTCPSFIVPLLLTVNVSEPTLLEILIQHHLRIHPLQVLSLIIQQFLKSWVLMPYSLSSITPKAHISSILLLGSLRSKVGGITRST